MKFLLFLEYKRCHKTIHDWIPSEWHRAESNDEVWGADKWLECYSFAILPCDIPEGGIYKQYSSQVGNSEYYFISNWALGQNINVELPSRLGWSVLLKLKA